MAAIYRGYARRMQLARVVLLVVLLVAPAVAAPTQLQKDRLAAAEKVFTGTVARVKTGQATADAAYAWSVRWLDAALDADPKTAKKAFADHLARMKELEAERAKARDAGTATTTDADAATYFRLEAEVWSTRNKR
jgi:hypothetical protein